MKKQKITIYYTSEFFGSVQSIEAHLIEHGKRKYAQYDNAPFVKFIPKGKRKIRMIQKSFKPYLLIVKNWNMPKPDDMYGKTEVKDNVIIRQSKYSCFDDKYKSDFDIIIDKYKNDFIADYREKVKV